MTLQITILSTQTQSDGSFCVSGVFWLVAPTSKIVSTPLFKSSVPQISDSDLSALRAGTIVERSFVSGLFDSSVTLSDVQVQLETLYTETQTTFTNSGTPITGLVGLLYDGSAWTNPGPPAASWIAAQTAPTSVTLVGKTGEVSQNADGNLQVSAEPRLGTEVVYGTHNFTDQTTWFGDSVRVVDEAAIDSGDGLTWNLAHLKIIDMIHGKVFDEDQYVRDQKTANPSDPHGYNVIVKVDGVTQVMRTPFAQSGGDYEVNYIDGKITFFSSKAGSTVLVDYSYENGSTFYIIPDAGFDLDIEAAKAMWSDNFVMNSSVIFEVYGYAAVFAPQLGLPAGTKIPISTTEYRTLTQLTSEASQYQPFAVPATGGSVRGITSSRHATHFRYGTIRKLYSAYGIELRVKSGNDIVMGGEFATATFYCVVKPSV
jgi:hypothetical protein